MRRLSYLMLVILLFTLGIACRAASNILPIKPSAAPELPSASPTIPPLATVTSEKLPTLTFETETSPTPPPDAALTETLPEDLETVQTEMPLLPMGTPFLDDSFRGVPVMPGAVNASVSADVLTYFTDEPAAAVLDFYQKVMPEDGWANLGGETENESSLLVIYSKGNKIATITVLPNITGTGSMVVIAVP